jgi:FkbH-like protein
VSVADYMRDYHTLPAPDTKACRIAFLSSSTANGLKEVLTVKCRCAGVNAEVFVGGYNQYNQEILDAGSGLYRFDPHLIILFIDTRSFLGDRFFSFYDLAPDARSVFLEQKRGELTNLISHVRSHSSATVVIHNLEVPGHSPLGILETKQVLGMHEFVERVNIGLNERFRDDSRVFIFDYNSFVAGLGRSQSFNEKLYYLADVKIDVQCLPTLADRYMSYVKPLMSLGKKCLALDLDNTLWGGVIGEDGIEGIKLGPTEAGRPFYELQKYILSLYQRGVILAINSKNNPEDALKVLRDHPHMILREEHFASVQINWNDKVSNLRRIAEEIDIGLDTIVFVDDDRLNCEMVATELPMVKVVLLPRDTALYPRTIMELDDFDTLQLTEEDRQKGRMYAEQKQRTEFSQSVPDITSYLKGLAMTVTIEHATAQNIPRIAQLTQKTNQFNMTTRRYLEEDIRRFSSDVHFMVICLSVVDKFGDNGITGAAIIEQGQTWRIDTLLLSCRVIGRRVEETLLAYIIEAARTAGAKKLIGEFIPTKKNAPAQGFYQAQGFTCATKTDAREEWVRDVCEPYPYPEFISVKRGS